MPGPGPGGQAGLRSWRSLLCCGARVWLGDWLAQAGAVPDDGPLDGFGQVVPQMPPVSDLGRQRRARSGALGVAAAAVTADDLRAGASSQARNDSADRSGSTSTGRRVSMSTSTVP